MHFGGTQATLRFNRNIGITGDGCHMAVAIGPHPQPLAPAGLHRRRAVGCCAQPAWSNGHQRTGSPCQPRRVIDRSCLHFHAASHQRHSLFTVKQNAACGDLVAQPSSPGLKPRGTATRHDGRAACLNLKRHQSAAHRQSSWLRQTRCWLPPPQHDRQHFAGQLIGCAAGHSTHHVDMVFKRNHIRRHVEAEAAAATDKHRRCIGGSRRRCVNRRWRRLSWQQTACQPFQPHRNITIETDGIDATNVGALIS